MDRNSIKTFFKNLSFTVFVGVFAAFAGAFLAVLVGKIITDLAFATGMLAMTTIILASLTYWNIHSRNAQEKRDRKERLLNEIIEWATDLIKVTHGQDVSIVALKGEELASAIHYGFTQLISRSKYIKKIASAPIFDKKLSKVVDEAINTSESCIEAHFDWMTCSAKDEKKKMKKAAKKGTEVEEMAIKVIEEATEIKTRDIR